MFVFKLSKLFFRLEMLNFCSELKMVLDKENYPKLARKLEKKNFQRIKNTLTILLRATRYIQYTYILTQMHFYLPEIFEN